MGLGIVVLLLVGAIATFLLAGIAPIVAGYEAKMLCSHLFVSQRKIEPVLASDLEPFNPLLGFVKAIPSRELVVVRLGLSRSSETRDHEGLVADILMAIGG